MRHRPTPRRRGIVMRAYTLIELLIVIGILGLAGAMLIPSINQPDTLKVQAVLRLIIADLSFAQSDALAQQELRRMYFYPDGSGYVILRDPFDPATDYIFDPLAPPSSDGAYIVNFTDNPRYSGITIQSADLDGGNNYLTFDELGGTVTTGNDPGTGGTIVVESPNAVYQITVAPFTGKLTVQKL